MTLNINKTEESIFYSLLKPMDFFYVLTYEDDPVKRRKWYFCNLGNGLAYCFDIEKVEAFGTGDGVYLIPSSNVAITIDE